MRDIPDYDEIVVKSSTFDTFQSHYPGTGPDGSGKADEADGPFVMLSPMLYAVEHEGLPKYLLDAVRAFQAEGSEATMDDALIEELKGLGYSQADIDALMVSAEEDQKQDAPETQPSTASATPPAPNNAQHGKTNSPFER